MTARAGPGTPAHDPHAVMGVPVLVLCILSASAGLVIQPGPWHLLTDYAGYVFGTEVEVSLGIYVIALILSLLAVLAGISYAYRAFGRRQAEVPDPESVPVLGQAFFWDRLYQAAVVGPLWVLGDVLTRTVEGPIVVGALDGLAGVASAAGTQARRLQSGYLRSYAMVFAAAVLVAVLVAGLSLR